LAKIPFFDFVVDFSEEEDENFANSTTHFAKALESAEPRRNRLRVEVSMVAREVSRVGSL
jgi:hypothetical protein